MIQEQCHDAFIKGFKKPTSQGEKTETSNASITKEPRNHKVNSTNISESESRASADSEVSTVSMKSEGCDNVKGEANLTDPNLNHDVMLSESKPKEKVKRAHFNELLINMSTPSEDILLHLAQETLREKTAKEALENDTLKIDDISLELEKDGIATLTHKSNSPDKKNIRKPFAITTDEDSFVISAFSDEDTRQQEQCENWGRDKLETKLNAEPNKYFKCKFSVKSQYLASATVLGPLTLHNMQICGKDVEIHGLANRGHALDGDLVVLEILNTSESAQLKGKVNTHSYKITKCTHSIYIN